MLGDTPDISVFRFHIWEKIEYYDPSAKQLSSGWLPGRFLGINRQAGDAMTYFVETAKAGGNDVVLTRSTIRSRGNQNVREETADQLEGSVEDTG